MDGDDVVGLGLDRVGSGQTGSSGIHSIRSVERESNGRRD